MSEDDVQRLEGRAEQSEEVKAAGDLLYPPQLRERERGCLLYFSTACDHMRDNAARALRVVDRPDVREVLLSPF